MAKNLVLVESPSKAKTINKYLGRNYTVEATVGHLRNLPKTKLGVDIDDGFKPKLLNMRGKGDLIKKIKSLAKKADKVFIATDPDREGEAIAQDIIDIIDGHDKEEVYRVLFHEITKESVKKSMASPVHVNSYLVISQRARRVMDRIIGYKLSPFLWRAMIEESSNSLSAGRVQSVALRLICEREEEINKFIPIEYWSLVGKFDTEKKESIEAKLFSVDNKTIKVPPKAEMNEDEWKEFFKNNFAIRNQEEAEKLFEDVNSKSNFHISEVTKKATKRNPYAPFITSTLQSEASKSLGFRPRKTMMVAQSLYEGLELGDEGFTGLITYMRTDSTRLNVEIVDSAREYIEEKFGKEYKPADPRLFGKKAKGNIQDAHEAIRPTSVNYSPEFVKDYLNKDQFRLYELIWKRFVASQMESAQLETTTVNIKSDQYIFRASGTAVKFPGFMALYDESKEDNGDSENGNGKIPLGLLQDQKLDLSDLVKNQHFTKPPPRFSESTLIKELESNGIGRPSTYASIMGTLQDREYVTQEQRKLFPSDLGVKVNKFLIENFPKIVEVGFTARMEEELDQMAEGEIEYEKALNDFYTPFASSLKEVEENIKPIECDKCGSPMDIRIGRFGRFLACTNYPDCKNIKSLKEFSNGGASAEPEFTGDLCPKCENKTIYRYGKFGKFIGCSNYPDCDFTKQIDIGMKCPKCKEGDVVVKRTRRAKIFYGCSKYPDCDYASWTKPKPEGDTDESEGSEE
ncbi:MAG: type I DNA topoisomerase [Melioribacteraceae bacterium]|nr:MAG: type I DNA topoisomerase [Melioribacteraceae bacterium]